MGGDEIVAEWLGDMDADRVQTTATQQRFSDIHYRCRSAIVTNRHHDAHAYLGKYYSNITQFGQNAFMIWENTQFKFEYVDLYEIGYMSCSGTQYLQLLCINHY